MEPPTVREVIRRLEKEGWSLQHVHGDHRRFVRDGSHVIVAGKDGEHLKRGTYSSICRIVGW